MITKETQQALRYLAAMAEELETANGLGSLEQMFHDWRAGKLIARELNRELFIWFKGPSREIHMRYHSGSTGQIVASELQRGILAKTDIPEDVH